MSLEIAGIQSYKNEIYFKKKEKLKDSKPQKENEDKESYFKRNKKAMLALSALGIAGIAIATHHHFKKTIKLNSGDLSELLSKSAKEKLEAFESKLSKEDAFEDIKNILAEDNNILKFEAIKQIIYKGAKHINKNSWEYIFNSVTNLKPTKQLKERFIIICTNNLLKVMQEKSLFSPEAIDQILLKTESLNDNFKINILHSLSESHFDRKSYREIRPDFSTEQMNKISDILDKIKGNDFLYHGRDFDTVIFPAGVRYQFNNIQFKNLKLNKNYISQFKKVIESDKLPDDLKLQLIDDIYYNVLIDRRSEYAIQLCKEMLLALEKNKADEYSLPNQFISFVHSKFGLGCRILNTITNYDSQNIVSLEEKFRFNQMLKKMSESIKITKGHITGNSGNINNLYNQELKLKSDIFFKNFSDKTTLTDIENFVNEMLNTYKTAKEHFIDSGSDFDTLDKEQMAKNFNVFKITVSKHILKIKNNRFNSTEWADAEKIEKNIENKINEFAKKYFNESSSSKHFKSGFYNTEDYVKSKTEQTVSEIINILSMDKDFKDIVEKLKANQLDMDTVKVLKRKVAIKYHPDKAKTESEKHAATERFQKIYGLIEILERTID